MTLQIKRPCWGCDEYSLKLHPKYKIFPELCPWCYGKKEIEIDMTPVNFPEDFSKVDWDKTQYNNEDLYAEVVCQCGDTIKFSESGQLKACSCGRVYRLSVAVEVNDAYVDNQEKLIELYKEK